MAKISIFHPNSSIFDPGVIENLDRKLSPFRDARHSAGVGSQGQWQSIDVREGDMCISVAGEQSKSLHLFVESCSINAEFSRGSLSFSLVFAESLFDQVSFWCHQDLSQAM